MSAKSQKLANELYSILSQRNFLQGPLMKLAALQMTPKTVLFLRRSMEFIKAFEAYTVFSQAEGQSKPAIEGKRLTFNKLVKSDIKTWQCPI